MVTSEIQICSNALLMLGVGTIASFTEDSDRALLCSNLWPTTRDATLRSHPWNCAIKRVLLAPDVVGPAFDWTYAFTLPGDCLRVWSVGRRDEAPQSYEVSDRKILMNEASCPLKYIQALTDVSRFDSLLAQGLTVAMEAILAYPITKSKTQQDASFDRMKAYLSLARTVDGMEDTGEDSLDSVLVAARFSG